MSTDIIADGPISANGSKPAVASPPPGEMTAADAVASLRRRARNVHLLGGFGPLVMGLVLFLLMLWVAPSVAPEHVVERPAATTTTTVTPATPGPATAPAPATRPGAQP
jgi:hypothetical protein